MRHDTWPDHGWATAKIRPYYPYQTWLLVDGTPCMFSLISACWNTLELHLAVQLRVCCLQSTAFSSLDGMRVIRTKYKWKCLIIFPMELAIMGSSSIVIPYWDIAMAAAMNMGSGSDCTDDIRWFPEIGVPPNHPIFDWDFPYKPSIVGHPHE